MDKRDANTISQILTYIKEDRYRQAVLIDGEWGAGKTFFIKEKLIKELQAKLPDKKVYYVSLYGVAAVEKIMDEICSSILNEKVEATLGEEKGKQVGKGISFASKLVMAGMKCFNIEADDLPKLTDLSGLKEAIFIFDDIERCELEINQTLGFINNLVEHNDIKVILVANQNEIGKINFSRELSHKYQVALADRLELIEKGKEKMGV